MYTSVLPNRYPSYHSFASANLSGAPKSAHIFFTSASVNPTVSSNPVDRMLSTYRLFRPLKMLSLESCITPVRTALSR